MSTQENVFLKVLWDFPGDSDGKESACNVETQVQSLGVKKIPWRKEWLPIPVFFPGALIGHVSDLFLQCLRLWFPRGRNTADFFVGMVCVVPV